MWRCGIFKRLLKSPALIGVKSHRLHLHLHLHCELSNAFSNCRPEYMLNHTCCICLTFLHCVFSNDSLNSWEDIKSHWLHLFDFFCLLKCILKLSKLDVTGCDFSPLCVSNVSSNVDEEICIQSGGFCASICWPSTQPGLSICHNDEWCDGYASTLIVDIQQYLSK